MIGHWITFTGTSILNSNLGIEDINFGLAHDYFHIFFKDLPSNRCDIFHILYISFEVSCSMETSCIKKWSF